MGTMEKQNQIKSLLKELNWGYRQLADLVLEEKYSDGLSINEDFNSEEILLETEKIKKHLQRASTPEERLNYYLKVISQHPEFEALKLGYVFTQYVEHECLPNDVINQLKSIKW